VQERPDPSEILVSNGLARVAELIDDLLHTIRIVFQTTAALDSGLHQTKAAGFIHDFIGIPIPKVAPVGKEQPTAQGVPCSPRLSCN